MSSTLTEPLAWANSRLVRVGALAELKHRTPLRTMGSLALVRSLLAAGVVDRLRLTVFPLIAGPRGREPFFADLDAQHLVLDHHEVLDGRIVVLEYRPSS